MRGTLASRLRSMVLAVALAACGGSSNSIAPSTPAPTPTPSPLAAGAPQLVRQVVDAVSQARWEETVRQLSGVDAIAVGGRSVRLVSRDSHTDGSRLAADHLQAVLTAMGYAVEVQDFSCRRVESRNLVIHLPGQSAATARVVLGAHYDSTNDRNIGDAPGADDNASGVASLVEAARVLRGRRFANPVDLVLFGAEEQGMCGSDAYLEDASARGVAFRGAILLDMVGSFDRNYELTIEGTPAFREWMDFPVEAIRTYTSLGSLQTFESEDSDHVPFQERNIPAYLLIESDWDHDRYHTAADTFANLEPRFGHEVTRAAVATLATAAGILE